jgi:YVTN family beta-propeller protein
MRSLDFRGTAGLVCLLFLMIGTASVLAEVRQKMYMPLAVPSEDGRSVIEVRDFVRDTVISQIDAMPGVTLARTTPDGRHVWLFSPESKSIEIVATAADEITAKIDLDAPVSDAIFNPDGSYCYIANGSYSGTSEKRITIIDVKQMAPVSSVGVGSNPVALAIQKDGSRLYCANLDDNSISVIDPRTATLVGTLFAGIEPCWLALSPDGRFLFTVNRGVELGVRGGNCVSVINTRSGRVVNVVETGQSPSSLGLSGDGSRLAVVHGYETTGGALWFYGVDYVDSSDYAKVDLIQKEAAGEGSACTAVDPSGKFLIVPDQSSGSVYVADLYNPSSPRAFSGFVGSPAYGVEFASVDIDREIAICDSIAKADAGSPEARSAHFAKAYLLSFAGDMNAVVSTYVDIASKYSGSSLEIRALLKLGDLCYNGNLLANAADYYGRGLTAYGLLLGSKPDEAKEAPRVVLNAAERLSDLSFRLQGDYFSSLYKTYAGIPAKLQELPELFLTFGVALKRQGDAKLAKKCFDETESRLIELMDPQLSQEIRFKLDIVRESDRAIVKAVKLKNPIALDGRFDDWGKSVPIAVMERGYVSVNQNRWSDTTDIAGRFHVGLDQYNLYIGVTVLDDALYAAGDDKADHVALYVDSRPGSGSFLTRSKGIDENVMTFIVCPPTEPGKGFTVRGNQKFDPLVGGVTTLSGYSFELKIPLAYLRASLTEKDKDLGFGLELFDIDSALESDPPKVMGWLMPAKSVYGPRSSEMFGILEL